LIGPESAIAVGALVLLVIKLWSPANLELSKIDYTNTAPGIDPFKNNYAESGGGVSIV
jgi:hypothetical protein